MVAESLSEQHHYSQELVQEILAEGGEGEDVVAKVELRGNVKFVLLSIFPPSSLHSQNREFLRSRGLSKVPLVLVNGVQLDLEEEVVHKPAVILTPHSLFLPLFLPHRTLSQP